MRCSICGGPVTVSERTDPAHAECMKLADERKRTGTCTNCGMRPTYHDGRCAVCS